MEISYPLENLGAYGRAVVTAKKAGGMEQYLKNIYRNGARDAYINSAIIVGSFIIGYAAADLITKHIEKKRSKKLS